MLLTPIMNHSSQPKSQKLISQDRELKSQVLELINRKEFKAAQRQILRLDLNSEDFPLFMDHLYRTALDLHKDQLNWKVIEENFYDNHQVLSIYVESLLKQNQVDPALSIIQRHDLFLNGKLSDDIKQSVSGYFTNPSSKTFNYLENLLFSQDKFAATEELLEEAPKGTYLAFGDLGLDAEHDLIFVDKDNTREFDNAINDILGSKEVGIDTQSKFQTTIFDTQATDLLQIATHKKVYIFDAIVLKASPKYIEFIRALLSSSHILKVGHNIKEDIEMLKNDAVEELGQVMVNHQANISKMYKELNIGVKTNLNAICEALLNKSKSKYEEVSNWGMRPLRKAQLCFSGLNALVCLKLHEILKERLSTNASGTLLVDL